MPRKKAQARRPRGSSFEASLRMAKKMFVEKTQRRIDIMKELEELDLAIPLLEKTVLALEDQLAEYEPGGGMADAAPISGSGSAASNRDSRAGQRLRSTVGSNPIPAPNLFKLEHKIRSQMERLTGAEIPAEVRAKLPPEDFTGMGSHFGDGETAEREDLLPEIEGEEVVQLKPKEK